MSEERRRDDLGWPEDWPSLDELRNASVSVMMGPLASAVGDAVARFSEHLDDEDAMLRLEAVVGPVDMPAMAAEVERRWELHQQRLRDSPHVRPTPRKTVIDSVRQDVAAGWL